MDSTLNAHAKPPDHIRQIYKKYQTLKALSAEQDIFDSHQGRTAGWTISQSARKELLLPDELQHIIASFLDSHPEPNETEERGVVYEHPDAPGKPRLLRCNGIVSEVGRSICLSVSSSITGTASSTRQAP